jgi:hypothetical protein
MSAIVSNSNAPLTFQAVWNEKNQQFAETFLEKITRTVFSFLNQFAVGLLLPALRHDREGVREVEREFEQRWSPRTLNNHFLKSQFRPTPIEVTTPDGVKLRGTFFKNVGARESAPTVIFYQPNATISKQGRYDWVMAQAALQEFSYNFVYFDYRGCGGSDLVAPNSKKDLFLDGECITQFVKDKLRVPSKDIHFYGWSLGGGISANVKKIDEERKGNYVNERSFNSIRNVLKNLMPSPIAFIAGIALWALNWDLDAVDAIEKLKGKTMVIHHPDDHLMRNEASLYHSLFQRGIAPSSNIQELNLKQGPNQPNFIHGAPLEMFNHQNFYPEHEIAKFLFSSNTSYNERMLSRFALASPELKNKVFTVISNAYQNGGHYWGSGEDAFYNRNGQSLTDDMRVKAITFAKLES